MNKRWKLIVAAILLLAFAIRVWGITFGLPHRYHIDEPYYVLGALKLARGEIHLTVPQNTPNLWQFVLLGEYAVLYLVGRVTGTFTQPNDLATLYVTDPSVFYLLGRLTSVLAGVATVWLTYLLGKEIWERKMGVLASFFLAVTFSHVRDSHYAVNDAFIVLLTTLTCYLSVVYMKRGNSLLLWLGAFACGAAIGMKYRPVAFALPLALAVLGRYGRIAILKFPLFRRTFLPLAITLPIGFLVGFPGVILNTAVFRHHAEAAIQQAGITPTGVVIHPAVVSYAWLLVVGAGLPLLITAVAGLVLSLRVPNRLNLLVVLTGVAYYILIALLRPNLIRYALPLLPLLAVYAAYAVGTALSWIGKRRPTWALPAGVVAVVVLTAIPLVNSVRSDYLLTQVDTRTLAKTWIEEHIPPGSKIALDWPVHGPPLSTDSDPEPDSQAVYYVMTVGLSGLSEHSLRYYQEEKYDYIITSSYISEIQHEATNGYEFYASLDRELAMVQGFWPGISGFDPPYIFDEIYGPVVSQWQRARPGPVLKIYKVNSTASSQ